MRAQYILLLLCAAFPLRAITTPEIAASALTPDCVKYRVVGLCYWLYCTPFGCTVRTSVKVSHFRPDLVVSAYSNTGQNTWAEMSLLSPPLPGVAEGGGDTNPRSASQHSKVRFKNADAIGFPAGDELAKFFTQFGYICSPSSQPFQPYFLSQLDTLAWRSGVPEMTYPEALTPGMREVGQNGDMWGNIYPRAGAISQTHDYKAAAVAVLPCKPDLRQLRFEVQHTRIADPVLAQELQDFVNDCYGPSRARLKRLGSDISEEQSREVDWVGSVFYLTTLGYYDHDHSHTPRAAWPYDASRDDGLNDTGGGGYPACKEWWSDGDAGLKNRLLKQVDTTLWQQLQKLGQSKDEYEQAVLRSLVSPRNMQVSQGGLVYNGFGGNAGDNLNASQALSRLGSIAGMSVSSLALFPAFDSVRQALPMVQAFLGMALVICIPVILLFSAWELKTVVTLSFVQFALFFLTFWWELARWLDSWLMEIIYNAEGASHFNLYGLQNASDDLIVNVVMGTMFVVLPAFWLGALTWAGARVGGAVAGVISAGSGDVKNGTKQVERVMAR
ncbi:TIGR03756 family integrating conjugative element protein [Escherichia coli]